MTASASQGKRKRQTEAERSRLRKEQRELAQYVQKEQAALADFTSDAADVAFQKIQAQHQKIGTAREGCVDSSIFRGLSGHISKQAIQLGVDGNAITWKHFLTKLKEVAGSSNSATAVDWHGLGECTSVFFSIPIPINFMLGPISVEKKIRVAAQRVRKNIYAAEKPATINHKDSEKKKKTEHERFQNFMCNQLKEKKKVGMFDFLFNPDSFTQTVENIFEFSFLVKDGWSSISVDHGNMDAQPTLETKNPRNEKQTFKSEKQAIISFNMADFENLKKLYNITDLILPHREDAEYEETPGGHDSDYNIEDVDNSENETQSYDKEGLGKRKQKSRHSDANIKRKRRKEV